MRARRLDMPWGRLRLWEAGEGPTTVLAVHGLGGSGRYWDGLAEALGDRFRVVAPDLGGFGGSSKPKTIRADRDFHLEALETVARSAGAPSVVIGHSLGGVLGLLWSARHAGDISGLVMAASPYPTPHPDWDPSRFKGARGVLPRVVVTTVRAGWPVLSLPVQAFGPYPAAVVRDYGRQSIRGRVWTLWSLWGDPALESEAAAAGAEIHGAGAAALLAYAADDRSVGPDNGDRWHEFLPGAERLTVASGAHQFLLRDRFASIAPFVRGLAVGGHG